MTILGLDPSTNVGWAIVHSGERIGSGVATLRGEHRAEKALDYRRWLERMLDNIQPDLVCYEEPLGFRGRVTVFLAGLCLLTETVCEERGVSFVSVGVSSLKKYATGSGRADKVAMIDAAREATGRDLTEHEADAYWTARWAEAHVERGESDG